MGATLLVLMMGGCVLDTSVAGSATLADAGASDARDSSDARSSDAGSIEDATYDAGEGLRDADGIDRNVVPDDSGVPPDACSPAAETCDATDQDCDGSIDEDGACAPCVRDAYGGHVYLFCLATVSWDGARAECASRGYDLVVIEDAAEAMWLWSIAGPLSGDEYFIGLEDRVTEGRFVWVDGTVARDGGVDTLFTAWTSNAPDNVGEEDCVELDRGRGGLWEDVLCDQLQSYVCES